MDRSKGMVCVVVSFILLDNSHFPVFVGTSVGVTREGGQHRSLFARISSLSGTRLPLYCGQGSAVPFTQLTVKSCPCTPDMSPSTALHDVGRNPQSHE